VSNEYDIIIIGSGVGGGTIALELAKTGKKILIIERGDKLPIEKENWNPREVFIKKRYRAQETWIDKKGREFRPNTNYWLGGNSTFYGAALMRMKRQDFNEVKHYGGEISPEWPLDYDDFAPFYKKAEKLWNVHGQRGIDPNDEINDPPYPYPAVPHDEKLKDFLDHLKTKGMTPSPLPLGINYNIPDNNSKCILCPTCAGHPCHILAKSDARTLCIDSISKYSNVTIAKNLKAHKLISDGTGKNVKSVVCLSFDGQETFSADIFILAAGAVNSAVILLNSANSNHENGLANSSDLVGRNYMFHTTSAMTSIMAHEAKAIFPKTYAIMDYYFKDKDGDFDFPMGQIQSLPAANGAYVEGQISHIIPHWVIPNFLSDWLGKHMISFMIMSEDLPKLYNRVTLTNYGKIQLDYTPNNLVGHRRLINKLKNALQGYSLGSRTMYEPHFEIDQMIPLLGTAHQCGTIKFGKNPKDSVLDINCKAHDLDNLYVTDSSFFPSSSAVNPALTIIANSYRVAEHIKERIK